MASLLLQTISLVLGAGAVEVAFAPDQPVSHIYLGESLVVELLAEENGSITVDVDIQSADNRGRRQRLGPFDVVAGQPYWFTVSALPDRIGPYQVRIRSTARDAGIDAEATVVRVNRDPGPAADLRLGIVLGDAPDEFLYGLRTLRVPVVCLRGPLETLEDRVVRVLNVVQSEIDVLVEANQIPDDRERLKTLLGDVSPHVRQWKLSGTSAQRVLDAGYRIKAVVPDAALAAVVRAPAELEGILRADRQGWIQGAVIVKSPDIEESVAACQDLARQLGYETFPITVLHDVSSAGRNDGPAHLRELLRELSNSDRNIWLDTELLYAGNRLQPAFGPVYAATLMLQDAKYYGSDTSNPAFRCTVFRYRRGDASDSEWCVVAWSDDGAKHALPWDLSGTDSVERFDAWGNSIPAKTADAHLDEVGSSRSPIYLTGRGGSLVEGIALESIRRVATELIESEAYSGELNADLADILKRIAAHEGQDSLQFEFLTLLRSLVDFELDWHVGQLEPDIALGIISRVASLARHIGILEQERGFGLLEPLDRTLTTCAQFQREYRLIPSPLNAARCEWLVLEMNRLMDEAQDWMAAGRDTEAKSVAALAEWRGRSLGIASRTVRIEVPEEAAASEEAEASPEEEKP